MTEESEQFSRLVSSTTRTIHNFNNDPKRNQRSWIATCRVMHKSVLHVKANWQRKQQINYTPCLDDNKFKNEELETVGELCDVRAQNV